MITDYNEDELYRLEVKLDMLMKCKRIEELGYNYEPDKYIYLNHVVEDGYEPVDQVEFISTILAPIIDYGTCDYTSNMDMDLLKSLNVDIPYSDYDTDCVIGMTIKMVNKYVDKYIDNNLDAKKLIDAAKTHINYICGWGESNVDYIQVILDKKEKALYLVIPDEYIDIGEFTEGIIRFLNVLHEAINNLDKREAA